jgi:RNA polymerase sigma-70 factor (ECF subfamily)
VLAEKLLVAGADGRVPAIADYGGRAPLSAWLRVAAIRAALNLRRGKANQVEPDHDRELAGLAGADDVALDAIRARYRPAFEAALARALAELPVRDRTLLRLRWIEGVGLEQLATMYGVHRATVTRWLADCRAQLAERARAILADELGATSRELDSLAELVRSQLHISVVRLLQT